jgi:3-hydroxyacyl-[acyl-carrier-protein] dehydratase
MRFRQLDRIVLLEPGSRIVAEKQLSPDEDYLRDHFPHFPVLPGVLMLEALYQAASWLVYVTDNYQHAVVRLQEARNVKFADFVKPGEVLRVTAEITGDEAPLTKVKAVGMVGESQAVSGRLVLERYNSADREATSPMTDRLTQMEMRNLIRRLSPQA